MTKSLWIITRFDFVSRLNYHKEKEAFSPFLDINFGWFVDSIIVSHAFLLFILINRSYNVQWLALPVFSFSLLSLSLPLFLSLFVFSLFLSILLLSSCLLPPLFYLFFSLLCLSSSLFVFSLFLSILLLSSCLLPSPFFVSLPLSSFLSLFAPPHLFFLSSLPLPYTYMIEESLEKNQISNYLCWLEFTKT